MKCKIRMRNLKWLRKRLACMMAVLLVFSNFTIFPDSNLIRAFNDIELIEDTVNVNEKLKLSVKNTSDDVIYDSIDWSVIDAGETGGNIAGEYFTATNSGTAVIEAKVKDTANGGLLFEKEMNIMVLEAEILENDENDKALVNDALAGISKASKEFRPINGGVEIINKKNIIANGNPILLQSGTVGTNLYYDLGEIGSFEEGIDQWIDLNEIPDYPKESNVTKTTGFSGLSSMRLFGGAFNDSCESTRITMNGGAITEIYGGGYALGGVATVTGDTNIQITSVSSNKTGVPSFFGGGLAEVVKATTMDSTSMVMGNTNIIMNGGAIKGFIYNGGSAINTSGSVSSYSEVTGNGTFHMYGGSMENIDAAIYGGGYAMGNATAKAAETKIANSTINIHDGKIFSVFGSGKTTTTNSKDSIVGTSQINVSGGSISKNLSAGDFSKGATLKDFDLNISGGTIVATSALNIEIEMSPDRQMLSSSTLHISGGTISLRNKNIYSSISWAGNVCKNKKMYISGGNILADIDGYNGNILRTPEDATPVYKVALTLTGVANGIVLSDLVTNPTDIPYRLTDAKTVVYETKPLFVAYLPVNTKVMSVNAGDSIYNKSTGVIVNASGTATGTLNLKKFEPVTNITLKSASTYIKENLVLSATVLPSSADNKNVSWAIKNDGGTGATINNDEFYAVNPGTATITATVKNGLAVGSDYTKDFNIQVKDLAYSFDCDYKNYYFSSPHNLNTITVTITNTGMGPLSISQPVHDHFDFGPLSNTYLKPKDTATFTVTPKHIPGSYEGNIVVKGDHNTEVLIPGKVNIKGSYKGIDLIKEIKSIAGCDKTVDALGLPKKVKVNTTMGTVSLPVDWDLNGLDYDPSDINCRELKIKGTVNVSAYVTDTQNTTKNVYATVILIKKLVNDKTGVEVAGNISKEKYLDIKRLQDTESNYVTLQSYLGKNQKVLDAFSIRLLGKTEETESKELDATIPIPHEYEGKLIQVIKKGQNGQINKLTTLVKNGKITVKMDENTQLLLAVSQQTSNEVKTANELVDAINNAGSNPTEIIIKDNIDLTSTVDAQALTVKKGQNITLIDDGVERIVTFTRPDGCAPSMSIEEGGILNLIGSSEEMLKIKIDGKGSVKFLDNIINKGTLIMDGVAMSIEDLSTYSLHSLGTLEIRNSTIQGEYLTSIKDKEQFNNGAIYLEGANSKTNIINTYIYDFTGGIAMGAYKANSLTVENSKFVDNGYDIESTLIVPTEKAGALRVEETEKLIVNHSSFDNNSSYEGGGIYCRKVNDVEISDSTFSNNKATVRGGGLYFAEGTKAVLNNVNIENCTVMEGNAYDRGGAGIYILDESIVEMNGGHIKDCEITIKTTSPYDGCGGGIYTGKNSRVTIDQNTEIAGNKGNMGGGIYTEKNNNKQESIIIKSAWIHKNTAVTDGGGIMILDETPIHMDNAVIRNNSVTRATRGGGGIWLCETGSFVGISRNGIAVFDNEVMTVSGMVVDSTYGKDVKVESPLSNKMKSIWFPETMLGGGDFNWQQDDINKVPADKAYYQNQKTSDKIVLAANPSEEAKKAAIAKATVIIEDNIAGFCGGGMGVNGKITSGYEQLTVKKIWAGDTNSNQPKEVEIQLYEDGVKSGKPIKLSSDNHWQYTWDKLDGQVKWTADEVSVPKGYTKTVKVEDTLMTFTNTYKKEDLPTQPDLPTDPDKPDEPNQPVNPDQPNLPENPDDPDTPILPVNPDHLDKPTKPDDNESPKTGDNTWTGWFATLVAVGAGLTFVISRRKRTRN